MTDSVFKNMKEKTYFLKPTCWKPSHFFSKMLRAQPSVTGIQFGVTETALVPRSSGRAGILTPPLTRFMTLGHFSQLSEPQFLSL